MTLLIYLLKVVLVSGGLYGYYYFFLRNKDFHLYNRYYLLCAAFIACVLPAVDIPLLFSWREGVAAIQVNMQQSLETITVGQGIQDTALLTVSELMLTIYVFVSLLVLFVLTRSLLYLRGICKRYPFHSIENISIYSTEEPGTPFSFFRFIFWDNKINLDSQAGKQILKHELYHVKQLHSFDLIVMELMISLLWVNPFFYLIKKELKTIHEFLADEYALTTSDKYEYAELLLLHTMQTKKHNITNLFFHNQIKRRINMITKNNNTSFTYARKVMVLPVAFLLLIACNRHSEDQPDPETQGSTKNMSAEADTLRVTWERLAVLMKESKEFSITQADGHAYISVDNSKTIYTMPSSEFPGMDGQESMSGIGKGQIFTKLQKEAEFPGGIGSWMRYLNKTFRYPDEAVEKEIQGTVVIQFIVKDDGSVSDVEAITGPEALKDEAVRVIRGSGRWIPGEMDGKKVHSYKKQPITFRLESE